MVLLTTPRPRVICPVRWLLYVALLLLLLLL
jgi:hypothetical protein